MPSSPDRHLAYFGRDEELAAAIGPHLLGAPVTEAIVILSTATHRDALLDWLTGHGQDVAARQMSGLLLWRDARETLNSILADGRPDPRCFEGTVAPLIEAAARAAPAGQVRAFGEIVGLLAAESRFEAAIQVEELWNALAAGRSFSLCCAYDRTSFGNDSQWLQRICHAHDDMILDPSWHAVHDPADRRRVVELECRAAAAQEEHTARENAENALAVAAEAGAALAGCLAAEVEDDGLLAAEAAAPILVWASGTDKLCHYFNDGWLTFTGRTAEQERGNGWADGVHPEDLPRCLEIYATAFDRRLAFRMEYRLRRADGAYRRILDAGAPRFGGEGRFLGYIGGCIDVTDRRAAQQAKDHRHDVLERVAREWTRAFDAMDLGVFVMDEGSRVNRVNRAGLRLMGGDAYGDAIGRSFDEMGDEEPWPTVRTLAAEAGAGQSAARAVQSPRRGQSWEVGAAPMIAEGNARWSIVTVRETTELTRLQEALRRSEDMAVMGTLITGVAHEVRNPLFGITATLDRFEDRLGDRPDYHQCSELLRGNVQRLTDLMQDLLDYARPLAPAFSAVPLSEIVAEAVHAVEPLSRIHGVTIRSEVGADLEPLRADRRRLVQVLQNVIGNAVVFSPAGSTVRVSAALAGERVLCEVEDSGPGFPPEEIPRIFEPFFTRRRDGTGLGLSIARRIVEAHAGTIEAANAPAGGAVVRIALPRAAPVAEGR